MILRSQDRVRDYTRQGGAITINREVNGVPVEVSRSIPAIDAPSAGRQGATAISSHYRGQVQNPYFSKSGSSTEYSPLENLIVSVKVHQTVSAITPLIPSITPDTSILLIQNGMGSYETLCDMFWPDPTKRPQFYLGITTHGVNSLGANASSQFATHTKPEFSSYDQQQSLSSFNFTHASLGFLKIARVPSYDDAYKAETENQSGEQSTSEVSESLEDDDISSMDNLSYEFALKSSFIKALQNAPGLRTQIVTYTEFLVAQMDKLIANAVINPLTAIYECYNGELTSLKTLSYLINKIAGEVSAVLKAEYEDILPPEVLGTVLNPNRLESIVLDVIMKTSENRSSMLQDIQTLKDTEVGHINGYIVRLGKKHHVGVLHNKMLMEMVNSKLSLARDRSKRSIPFVNI